MRWVVNSGEFCYDVGGLASPGFCFQGFSYRTEHTELALCCLSMHNGSKTPLDGQEKRVQPCLASIPGRVSPQEALDSFGNPGRSAAVAA